MQYASRTTLSYDCFIKCRSGGTTLGRPRSHGDAVNPAANVEALCTQSTLAEKRLSPPPWVTEFELSSYNIPLSSSADYVMDYLIPLSLGGANTVSNVWPQPRAEVERKSELEAKLRLRVCTVFRKRPAQEAVEVLINVQRYVAEDWTAAYADYVGH